MSGRDCAGGKSNMVGYTPGPWEWWTSNSWRRLRHSDRGKSSDVLMPCVNPVDGHPDIIVSDADMKLIAAAPDLLDALKDVRRQLAVYEVGMTGETYSTKINAAIDKAEHHSQVGGNMSGCNVTKIHVSASALQSIIKDHPAIEVELTTKATDQVDQKLVSAIESRIQQIVDSTVEKQVKEKLASLLDLTGAIKDKISG